MRRGAALCAAPGDGRAVQAVVTGGAGFIGSHLVEELLRRGYRVNVVDDLSTGSVANLDAVHGRADLDVTIGSVADRALADRVVAAADVVFHLAGVVGVQRLAHEPLAVLQGNLHATETVLAAAAVVGAPVLLASSSEVYGDGPVPFRERDPVRPGATEGLRGGYACAKALGEWLAMAHAEQTGLPVLVARLFNTVGPRQTGDHGMVLPRFVQQAVRGEDLTVYGGGRQTRCFAHVRDVARALADLSASRSVPGRVVNVGSDREVEVLRLAELVRERVGSRSLLRHLPLTEVFPQGFVDPPRRLPDLERLRVANGWLPATPIEAIVDELVQLARQATVAGAAADAVCMAPSQAS